MKFRTNSDGTESSHSAASRQHRESGRVSIVPDWFDAELMRVADLTGELAGLMVVPAMRTDEQGSTAASANSQDRAGSHRSPGFLFTGDDGDSLWFWPESEQLAFRLEHGIGNRLRKQINEPVARLVNQGALVYCHHVRSKAQSEQFFEFPEYPDLQELEPEFENEAA